MPEADDRDPKKAPPKPAPSRPASPLTKSAAPIKPAGLAPRKAALVPPKQMVTAEQRLQMKEQRRAAAPPRAPAIAAPAAASNEALKAEVDRFNALHARIMLTEISDDLEDTGAAIAALPGNLDNIRARGYVFKNHLEGKAEALAAQWREVRPRVEAELKNQARALQAEATAVQNTLHRGALAGNALATLESKVTAAINHLRGMYDSLDDGVNEVQRQIDDISWTLQQAEQASYPFLATEAVVEAVPANWKAPDDKDGVDGVLLLTDMRLIFEQKEEVATKKVLFITTEKQKVQQLAWEVPVAYVDKATGSKRGFMNKDDFLTLELSPEAPFRGTELHLKGETGEAWQAHITRVKSGEIAKERTVPVDQAAVEKAQSAPTQCPNCGGAITQAVLRGQTEITCEFCGTTIRL